MTGTTSKPRRDFHVEGHGKTNVSQAGSGFEILFLGPIANPVLNLPKLSFTGFNMTATGLNNPVWTHT